jgi:hypothetical protein
MLRDHEVLVLVQQRLSGVYDLQQEGLELMMLGYRRQCHPLFHVQQRLSRVYDLQQEGSRFKSCQQVGTLNNAIPWHDVHATRSCCACRVPQTRAKSQYGARYMH